MKIFPLTDRSIIFLRFDRKNVTGERIGINYKMSSQESLLFIISDIQELELKLLETKSLFVKFSLLHMHYRGLVHLHLNALLEGDFIRITVDALHDNRPVVRGF